MEIEGIRVQAVVGSPGNAPAGSRRRDNSKVNVTRGGKAGTGENSEDPRRAGTGLDAVDEGSGLAGLPTAGDLAQSFLQSEPAQEKAELKSAIAKSHHLDQSMISEDGTESIDEGIGTGLSLPTFVADFIKGVTDRLRITIKDIQAEATLTFNGPNSKSIEAVSTSPEEIIVCLIINSI